MTPSALAAWLDHAPLWLIGLVLLVSMALAAGLGSALRRTKRAAAKEGDGPGQKEGYIVSATLGLLALLMGFTFSLAIDRFETRRALVLEEANAIGTTYLRAQLLEEPHRARISQMLVAYTDNRIALATAPDDQIAGHVVTNDQLITDFWTATVAAFPSIKGYDFSSSFLETMNDVIDLDAKRKAARMVRVPQEVFLVLLVYVVTAAGVLGYAGGGKGGHGAMLFLFLLLAISLLLTLDIDRPTVGGVRATQLPMLQLKASLAAQPPAVFDRHLQ
jgi:hypothetical protein